MSESCNHDCSSCNQNCDSRSMIEPANANSNVKKVIGVVSGKGGVGKSLVTGLMAIMTRRKGWNTAILDADVTGPSIPRMFGLHGMATGTEAGIDPMLTENSIKIMSANLLLEDENAPVVWRGPMVAGMVKQFWTDVAWGDVDFMYVDMPPGTSDVPLTVFQSLPLDGIIIVTSPQELVEMIVQKAIGMAQLMNIPVLGIIENYSWMSCPDCGKKLYPFGEGRSQAVADKLNVPLLAQIPMDTQFAVRADAGEFERVYTQAFDTAVSAVEELLKD